MIMVYDAGIIGQLRKGKYMSSATGMRVRQGRRDVMTGILLGAVLLAGFIPAPLASAADDDAWAQIGEMHRLRVEVRDFDAAREMADALLADATLDTLAAQAAAFEYGATYYDVSDWRNAAPLLQDLVADFGDVGLDPTAADFRVDDALLMIAEIQDGAGVEVAARATLEHLLARYADSDGAPAALLRLGRLYERADDLVSALACYEELRTAYVDDAFADDGQLAAARVLRTMGDVHAALRLLRELPERWPTSDCVSGVLCTAAELQAELGDFLGAVTALESFIADHDATTGAVEAQLQLGRLYRKQQMLGAAADVFGEVLERWPTSELCGLALQELNRTLIEEDGVRWQAGEMPGVGGARNETQIIANLDTALGLYPDSAAAAGTILDVINYYAQPFWWMSDVGPYSDARIIAYAEQMIRLYPADERTWAARSELASHITRSDPDRALALLEASALYAIEHADLAHYAGAMYGLGSFYWSTGRPTAARMAFDEVLASAPSLQLEANALVARGHVLAREGNFEAAIQQFNAVVDDTRFNSNTRGSAALSRAAELDAAGRRDEAYAAIEAFMVTFPDHVSMECAEKMREAYARPRVIVKHNRPARQ